MQAQPEVVNLVSDDEDDIGGIGTIRVDPGVFMQRGCPPLPLVKTIHIGKLKEDLAEKVMDALKNVKEGEPILNMFMVPLSLNTADQLTKAVKGTLEQVMSSADFGLDMSKILTITNSKYEDDEIKSTFRLDGIHENCHLFYCSKWIGQDKLPGSDGFCGPYDGPHCGECDVKQRACADKVELEVHILCDGGVCKCTIRYNAVASDGGSSSKKRKI